MNKWLNDAMQQHLNTGTRSHGASISETGFNQFLRTELSTGKLGVNA